MTRFLAALILSLITSLFSDTYTARDFNYLLGMEGFSNELLKSHFKLYEGYVRNVNLLMEQMEHIKEPEVFGALKHRFGWEWDGMRLHEYYFENLGEKGGVQTADALYRKIEKDFGSFEQWRMDFEAVGMVRGIGWAILYRDPRTGRLLNVWVDEHDMGHLAGCDLMLVMDLFEHAYMPQYGLDRKGYILAFFKNIDWEAVSKRYRISLGSGLWTGKLAKEENEHHKT